MVPLTFEAERTMGPLELWEWNRAQYGDNYMNDPTLYDEWIEALESSKYTPTKAVLHSADGGFCCLGVLCDIYDPHQWQLKEDIYTYNDYETTLPNSVQDELNLVTPYGLFQCVDLSDELLAELNEYLPYGLPINGETSLAEINDNLPENVQFSLIKKILTERPRSLFKHE